MVWLDFFGQQGCDCSIARFEIGDGRDINGVSGQLMRGCKVPTALEKEAVMA